MIMSCPYRLRCWLIGWALLSWEQSAYAAADGVESLSDLLFLLLLLASPVLVLLLGLALWRWAWQQKASVDQRPSTLDGAPVQPSQRGSVATDRQEIGSIAFEKSNETYPSDWRTNFDRASLAFLAIVFVVLPSGLLIDSVVIWWHHDPSVITFAFGPGTFLCYLPVAVGLLLRWRKDEGWAAAALMTIATAWVLFALFKHLSVLQINLATYGKLANPGLLEYLRLVLPMRQFQLMITALVWLFAASILRGVRR